MINLILSTRLCLITIQLSLGIYWAILPISVCLRNKKKVLKIITLVLIIKGKPILLKSKTLIYSTSKTKWIEMLGYLRAKGKQQRFQRKQFWLWKTLLVIVLSIWCSKKDKTQLSSSFFRLPWSNTKFLSITFWIRLTLLDASLKIWVAMYILRKRYKNLLTKYMVR